MTSHPPSAKLRAFTLLELLLSVILTALVLGLLIPVAQRGVAASRSASCLGNQRIIGGAIYGYAADNQQWLPACVQGSRLWYQVITPYLPAKSPAYRCPGHRPTIPDWLSYGYNAKFGLLNSSGQRTVVSDPGMYERHNLLRFTDLSRTTMLIDLKHGKGTPNYNNGNGPVFYYDGNVAEFRHLEGTNVLWVDGRATHESKGAVEKWNATQWAGSKNYRP